LRVRINGATVLVCRRESRQELSRDVERLLVREVADPLQQRREIFPIDELHRQEVLAGHLRDVVHAADVRMRELPRDADFGEEALTAYRVRRQRRRQEFQRDGLAELQIVGAIDLAHPAAAEQADDAIPRRSTVPGVSPPTGTESDEISRPTPAATAPTPAAIVVAICEAAPTAWPHDRQNRLSAGSSVAHDGHRTARVMA
jgi:hypothetical protein